jgi:hypothetical protein
MKPATHRLVIVNDGQLNQPALRIALRSASAFLNSIMATDRASTLQRVCSITRKTRLMRSQGCQRRASVQFTSSSARAGPQCRGGK